MEHFLEQGETLERTIRKHWIVYVEDFFIHTVGGFLCIVLAHYLIVSKGIIPGLSITLSQVAMILVGFVILFWTSLFFAWTKHYFDVWFLTNKQILAVNQKEILEREELSIELSKIQDVFFERSGFLGTVLGYGTLRVQSAGTEQELVMTHVAHVESVAQQIIASRSQNQSR